MSTATSAPTDKAAALFDNAGYGGPSDRDVRGYLEELHDLVQRGGDLSVDDVEQLQGVVDMLLAGRRDDRDAGARLRARIADLEHELEQLEERHAREQGHHLDAERA